MLDSIMGLPLHPLVVHAAVVLYPIIVLGTIAVVWRSAWQSLATRILVGANVLGFLMVFITSESGESLEHRVGREVAKAHTEQAEVMNPLALLFLLSVLVWVWARANKPSLKKPIAATLTVIGLGTVIWLAVVGHSGATSVWQKIMATTTAGSEHEYPAPFLPCLQITGVIAAANQLSQ